MYLRDSLIYDIWLSDIKGIGTAAQHVLLDAFGFASEVYRASEADLKDAGISEKRRRLVLEARDLESAKRRLDRCRELGVSSRDRSKAISLPSQEPAHCGLVR